LVVVVDATRALCSGDRVEDLLIPQIRCTNLMRSAGNYLLGLQ